MSQLWNELERVLETLFRPDSENKIWAALVLHDQRPLGKGRLYTTSAALAKAIVYLENKNQTNLSKNPNLKAQSIHVGVHTYAGHIGNKVAKRSELIPSHTYGVFLDIDFKDNPGATEADIINRLNNVRNALNLGPFCVVNTTNGLHVYYAFDDDVAPIRSALHRKLCEVHATHKIVVDPAHSHALAIIRILGTRGKCGKMVLGDSGSFGGQVSPLDAMLTALGTTYQQALEESHVSSVRATPTAITRSTDWNIKPFNGVLDLNYTDEEAGNLPRTELDRAWWDQVPINKLYEACPAAAEFRRQSDSHFSNGSIGLRDDARMFASIIRHTYKEGYPTGDMVEKQDDFVSIDSRWPTGSETKSIEIFQSIASIPPFRCNKWAHPHYKAMCGQCKYNGILRPAPDNGAISPIDATVFHMQAEQQGIDTPEIPQVAPQVTPLPVQHVQPATPAPIAQLVTMHRPVRQTDPLQWQMPSDTYRVIPGASMNELPFLGRYVSGPKGQPGEYKRIATPAFYVSATLSPAFHTVHGSGTHLGRKIITAEHPDHEVSLSIESLNNANVLSNELSAAGVSINPNYMSFVKEYAAHSMRAMTAAQLQVAQEFGFSDKNSNFTLPGRMITNAGIREVELSPDLIQNLASDGTTESAAPHGSSQTWNAAALQPLMAEPTLIRLVIAVLASLSAPFYNLVHNESGPVVNFYGGTTLGKTTALKIANSVWFPHDKIPLTARDTGPGSYSMVANYRHLPVTFDEMATSEQERLYELCYQVTGGRDKSRSNTRNTSEIKREWKTVVIGASNGKVRTRIAPLAGKNLAVIDRVIDIDVEKPNMQSEQNRLLLMAAEEAIAQNFGVLGFEYAQYLMKNMSVLSDFARDTYKNRKYGRSGRFYGAFAAYTYTAAWAMTGMGYLTQDNLQTIDDELALIDLELRASRDGTVESAKSNLADFIMYCMQQSVPADKSEYQKQVVLIASGYDAPPNDRLYCWEDDERYFCTPAFIQRYLQERDPGNTVMQFLEEISHEYQILKMPFSFKHAGYRRRLPMVKDLKVTASSVVDTSTRIKVHPIPKWTP